MDAIAAAAAPSGGPECGGVLAAFDLVRVARIAAARRSAAFHLGRWLLLSDAGERAQVDAGLARAANEAAKLEAEDLAATWKDGIAGDRARVEALEP